MGDNKTADTCSVDPSSWQLHMQQALAVGAQDVAHFLDCSWPAVEEEAAPNADDEDNSWGEESTCQEEVQASMDNKIADGCSLDPSAWQLHMQQARAEGASDVTYFLDSVWPAKDEDIKHAWSEESACHEDAETSADKEVTEWCSEDASSWQVHRQQALAEDAPDVIHFLDSVWPAVEE